MRWFWLTVPLLVAVLMFFVFVVAVGVVVRIIGFMWCVGFGC